VTQTGTDAGSLAGEALEWLLGQAREHDDGGLAWPGRTDDDELDPTLYSGTAGIVVAFLEGYRHFGDDRYAVAAARGARTLAVAVDGAWDLSSSLAVGLAGLAFALHAAGGMLADRTSGRRSGRWAWSGRGSTGSGGETSSSCSAATRA
jgi:hypothetical protein